MELIELNEQSLKNYNVLKKRLNYSPDVDHLVRMLARLLDQFDMAAKVVDTFGQTETTIRGDKVRAEADLMIKLSASIKGISEQLGINRKGEVKEVVKEDTIAELIKMRKVK